MLLRFGKKIAGLFHVDPDDIPKLLMFGLFGLLLEGGLGIGFCAADAAFLTNIGADHLPLVFLLTPIVMVAYTILYSWLLVRFSLNAVVRFTLAALVVGGVGFWGLLGLDLSDQSMTVVYFGLKLYLAMWQVALFSLFWNFADTYFDIQDAKRLFPLFAAASAAGMAAGSLLVSGLAAIVPLRVFFLLWGVAALATLPVAANIQRRFVPLAEDEYVVTGSVARSGLGHILAIVRGSPYTMLFTGMLFATLLLTNLAEFQYSTVLSAGRDESQLAALLGNLYALANIFNMIFSLLIFNRLVGRLGVRNILLILPIIYFTAFSYFFVHVGAVAAVLAFMTNHAILTAIEHNNQNLLFNALPSQIKHRLRTIIEGLCEPFSSCLAGAFLLFVAPRLNLRELSGIGILLGAIVIIVALFVRNRYPAAMAANMQRGWLDFSKVAIRSTAAARDALPLLDTRHEIEALLEELAHGSDLARKQAVARLQELVRPGDAWLVPHLIRHLTALDRDEQAALIGVIGMIGDSETIPQLLATVEDMGPRERRSVAVMLAGLGELAVPALVAGLRRQRNAYTVRRVAGRALAAVSYPQFAAMLPELVRVELMVAQQALEASRTTGHVAETSVAAGILSHHYRERVAAAVDYVLNLLALGQALPSYDLLVSSLNSANRKVRANAIEAIENGVDRPTFAMLRPLLNPTGETRAVARDALMALLEQALQSEDAFEAAAAAQCLRDLLPAADLAAALRKGLRAGMPVTVRETIAALLGMRGSGGATMVDTVAALRARYEYRYASTPALMALAIAGNRQEDIDRISGRFYDLALSRLKAQDEVHDAA